MRCQIYLNILDKLLIEGRYRKTPRIITVIWQKKNLEWTKINMDGSVRDNLAAAGAIARDHQGEFLGAFFD